jgi:hypothetical protein
MFPSNFLTMTLSPVNGGLNVTCVKRFVFKLSADMLVWTGCALPGEGVTASFHWGVRTLPWLPAAHTGHGGLPTPQRKSKCPVVFPVLYFKDLS